VETGMSEERRRRKRIKIFGENSEPCKHGKIDAKH